MKDFSYITNSSPAFIESLYNDFVNDPTSVDAEYRKFFEGFDFAVAKEGANGKAVSVPASADKTVSSNHLTKELGVYQMIIRYRKKGHLLAKTNPIRERKNRGANLDLENFGLSDADMDTEFEAGKIAGLGKVPLGKIVDHLKRLYTGHVGLEYLYIT
ncbi:MAG: 2-oxoglutarate dehydrogenase E1 component, partial [Chitinophagaceae bacterium]|nr:2-oxoglutarate dehydrogenase E1 component [Chitinophagaceae bacterium]